MKKSTIMKNWRIDELRKELTRRKKGWSKDSSKSNLVDVYMRALDDEKAVDVKKGIKNIVKKTLETGSNGDYGDDVLDYVFKEGILYRIDSHCWWGKSSRVDEEEINAPKEILSGVKTLVDPNTLATLRSYKSYGERIIKKRSYPFLGLRGVYYVPKAFISGCEEELKETQGRVYGERDFFMKNLPKYKKEWAAVCKKGKVEPPAPELYPSKDELNGKFVFEWTKFAITLPNSSMKILNEAELKEEAEKQKKQMFEFLDGSLSMLAGKFYKAINNLAEKLSSGDPMKPKTLSSVRDFIETFDAMNVTNNAKLQDLVGKVDKLVGTASVKDYNADEKLRKDTEKRVTQMVSSFKKISESDQRFKRDLDF
jgi:uncharacterized protein (UPF0297 family)